MAKQDIKLQINTQFNGEGFKKMNQAVQGAAGSVRSASKNINSVVQALGGVEGQVGKIFNGISGIMGGFAQGGAFGLAVAGIGMAFKFVMDKIEEAKKKAEEAAKAMKDAWEKAFNRLGERISAIRGAGGSRVEQSNYDAGRLSKDITREQRNEIAKIRSEGIDRRSAMTDEDEKALDLAEEELKIQQLITKSIKEQNDLKVKQAQTAYNAKVGEQENSTKAFNDTIESYNKQMAEIGEKIDAQQKKLEAARKHNASDTRYQTLTTTYGQQRVDTYIDTKPMEDEIARLTKQSNELGELKEKAVKNAGLEKSQKEVERAFNALTDATKDREVAMNEATLAEKKAAQKVKEASDKMKTGWAGGKGTGENDPEKFVEETNKEIDARRRKEAQEEIAKRQKEGADEQKKLNEELQKAQRAVRDWIDSFKNNKHTNFADFNKGQNQAAKDNAVQVLDANGEAVVGPDGEPLTMDKRQANKVKSNRQQLDRLLKMKNPDARTRKEIERRQAFDDMFNGEKIKERMQKEENARKAKEEADKKMRDDIDKLKKLFVDDNGAAV